MALFDKKEDATPSVDVTALLKENEALKLELTDLRDYKVNQENKEALQVKASELGFTGDVNAILTKTDGNLGLAFGDLITAFNAELVERKAANIELSAEEDDGDADSSQDVASPKTKTDAMNIVRSTYNLKGRKATLKARELFGKLWEIE